MNLFMKRHTTRAMSNFRREFPRPLGPPMRRSRLLWAWGALVASVLALGCAVDVVRHDHIDLPDGGRLAFHVRPADWPENRSENGPALVLIPGSWGDRHVYDDVLATLDPDIDVVIVELRGHGDSWPPTLDGSMESFAADVLRVTGTLDLDRFFIGGHSIGGMVAIEVAGRRPESVAGVISIEGWTHHDVPGEAFGGALRNTLSPAQEARRQADRARVLDRLTDEEISSFASIWKRWDGSRILETTAVPVLELWGDRRRPTPLRATMRIPDRPGIELVWLENASHSLLIERPAEVAALINRFVASIESGRDG